MAGYADTRQMIIDTLMGRMAGTEIQPEDHQKFALQITEYIRSVELVAGNATPMGFANANTVPVQPDNGQAVYLSSVGGAQTVTFSNFIGQNGNPISVTSTENVIKLVTLLWNGQYWDSQITSVNAIRDTTNGYLFMGVAKTTTNPGTPDQKVFYIANGKGSYTNFGSLSVTEDEVVILYYDNSWHKVSTGIASQEKLSEVSAKIKPFREVFNGTGGESGYGVTNHVYGFVGTKANSTLIVLENIPGAKLFSNFTFTYFYANDYDSSTHTASDIRQGASLITDINGLANGYRYIIASFNTADVSDIRMIAAFLNTENVGIPMLAFADACESINLNEAYGLSGNLLTTIEKGYYINNSGVIVAATGGNSAISSFIKCRTNVPLVISGVDKTLFASSVFVSNVLVYDENKTQTRFLKEMSNKPFSLRDGERYIRICLAYNFDVTTDVSRMQKIQGVRVNYGISKSPSQGILRIWSDIKEKYEARHTTNLIDNSIYTEGWKQDYSEWNTTDSADTNANHKSTSFFATKPNTIYYIYSKANALERVKMYDAEMNFVASYYANVVNEFSFLDNDNVRWDVKKFITPFAYASIQTTNPNHTIMVVSTTKVSDYASMVALRENDVVKVVEMADWEKPNLVMDTTGMVINTNTADSNKFLLPVTGGSVYTIWSSNAYYQLGWVTDAIIYDADLVEIGMVKKYGFTMGGAMQEGFPPYLTYVKMPNNAAYISMYHNCIAYPYMSIFEGFIFDSERIMQLWQNITIDNPVFRNVINNSAKSTDGYLITIGDSLTAQGTWQLYVMRALRLANGSSEWYSDRGGVGGCRILPTYSGGVVQNDSSIWYRTKHLTTIFGDSSYILETANTIIVMGGTNDVAKMELLGSVNDLPLINDNNIPMSTGVYYKIKNSDASQYQKTDLSFASAFKGIIQNLQTEFPTKHLVMVSPHCNKMTQYASTRAEMDYMVDLMHKICDIYNVQFVDIYHNSGISLYNASSLLVDDVHTSPTGGLKLGECIAAAIS